jgi:hypothetical protein
VGFKLAEGKGLREGGIRKNCGNLWKTQTPYGNRHIGTRLNSTFENHLSDWRVNQDPACVIA